MLTHSLSRLHVCSLIRNGRIPSNVSSGGDPKVSLCDLRSGNAITECEPVYRLVACSLNENLESVAKLLWPAPGVMRAIGAVESPLKLAIFWQRRQLPYCNWSLSQVISSFKESNCLKYAIENVTQDVTKNFSHRVHQPVRRSRCCHAYG